MEGGGGRSFGSRDISRARWAAGRACDRVPPREPARPARGVVGARCVSGAAARWRTGAGEGCSITLESCGKVRWPRGIVEIEERGHLLEGYGCEETKARQPSIERNSP